jgi:hypothetical protein
VSQQQAQHVLQEAVNMTQVRAQREQHRSAVRQDPPDWL